MVSLAGVSLAMVRVSGRSIDCVAPLARTVTVCEPGLASFGTSTRSCRLTLSLMPGIAAATGWPPPRMSAFQPSGAPSTDSASVLGREARVLQLEADVGDLARPHGLRRVVGQQPQALDGGRRRRIGGEDLHGDENRSGNESK